MSIRRFVLVLALGLAPFSLAGCPIYMGDSEDGACGNGECSPSTTSGGACVSPSGCPVGETCGSDDTCHPGTCDSWGCPNGYYCGAGDLCTPFDSAGGGGAGGGSSAVYCGNPDDCAATETCSPDGTCQPGLCQAVGCIFGYICDPLTGACLPENPAACGSHEDCAAFAGAKCVSGVCTPPQDQCFDQTQCPSGAVCADGVCVPSCANGENCPSSYTCDAGVGLCDDPAQSCVITNDCASASLVCVDGACVPRATGGTCDTDFVWVENGCIPDQSPLFVCNVDGLQDACASGSICLHHSCYISCEAPNQSACTALPSFNQCKTVTTTSGPHQVCGSSENLGDQCDPTAGLDCSAGLICIDGYCK